MGLGTAATVVASCAANGRAREIAALVSWLVSDEAVNVNGAIVTSDGGWPAA